MLQAGYHCPPVSPMANLGQVLTSRTLDRFLLVLCSRRALLGGGVQLGSSPAITTVLVLLCEAAAVLWRSRCGSPSIELACYAIPCCVSALSRALVETLRCRGLAVCCLRCSEQCRASGETALRPRLGRCKQAAEGLAERSAADRPCCCVPVALNDFLEFGPLGSLAVFCSCCGVLFVF